LTIIDEKKKIIEHLPRDASSGRETPSFDPSAITDVESAVLALQNCGPADGNLGKALEVLAMMVSEPSCLRVLAMSGAMIPAGMEEIICQLVERHVVNVIVTTGANITHSLVNVLGEDGTQAHYLGSPNDDDVDLSRNHVFRIYDTVIPENEFDVANETLYQIIRSEFPGAAQVVTCPSELFALLGKKITKRCMLKVAHDNGVPVFCGATSDSELGINLMKFRDFHDLKIVLDEVGDIGNFSKYITAYPCHGTIIIGGGVPRNWTQQVFPYIHDLEVARGAGLKHKGYDYSVRFYTAVPDDGGCSGCTISENVSWGKYHAKSMHQEVWGDATVSFPLVVTALFQMLEKRVEKKGA